MCWLASYIEKNFISENNFLMFVQNDREAGK